MEAVRTFFDTRAYTHQLSKRNFVLSFFFSHSGKPGTLPAPWKCFRKYLLLVSRTPIKPLQCSARCTYTILPQALSQIILKVDKLWNQCVNHERKANYLINHCTNQMQSTAVPSMVSDPDILALSNVWFFLLQNVLSLSWLGCAGQPWYVHWECLAFEKNIELSNIMPR